MAVPVDIEQADKQPAQPKRHQPDGVQRRDRNGVTDERHERVHGVSVEQNHPACRQRHQAADRPANPGDRSHARTAVAAKYATALVIIIAAFISPPR